MTAFEQDLLEDYLDRHSTEKWPLLQELYRETWTSQMNPRMSSGPILGNFLMFISRLVQPMNILEIGTFTGYSAICLSQGLAPGGSLHTIDLSDEVQEIALKYFLKAGIDQKIKIHTGDAIQIIPHLGIQFDLVFIDGEKREYPEYYQVVFPVVKPGGIILADNVLWDGKVLYPDQNSDLATRSIQKFNHQVASDNRVKAFIHPLRDGLFVIQKK